MADPASSPALPDTYVEGFHDLEAVRRMPYRPLGDRLVSVLSFGASSLAGVFRPDVSLDESIKVVHTALRRGVNVLDTAPWYGHGVSETVLGKALVGVPRAAYYLHTKVGRYQPAASQMFDFTYERTLRSVCESLARLGVEYIDTVQIHDPEFAPNLDIVVRETLPALEELRKAGKIRYIGITGYPLEALRYLADHSPVRVHTAISYCRYNLHCTDLVDSGTLAHLNAAGIAVINASPLSMGLLTPRGPPSWHPASPALKERCAAAAAHAAAAGVDIAHLALHFCLEAAGPATTMISTASVARIEADIDAATGLHPLSDKERAVMGELRARFFDPASSVPSGVGGAGALVPYPAIQAWEGAEPAAYWAKLGRELMTSAYARVQEARAAGQPVPPLLPAPSSA